VKGNRQLILPDVAKSIDYEILFVHNPSLQKGVGT